MDRKRIEIMASSQGLVVVGNVTPAYKELLNPGALAFLIDLHRGFNKERIHLLHQRLVKQKKYDAGMDPTFLPETEWVRQSDWKGPKIPDDLVDRRVEITGPAEAKMIINALNSGAKVFMTCFEDAISPTWDNMMQGQISLLAANNRTLTYKTGNKVYRLRDGKDLAVLMVRPRGWHLQEDHVLVDGEPMSGSLFDFGLYFYHNAKILIERGSGPYFYLAKMESYLEARLWNSVFLFAQERCRIPRGTIRATCLIETFPAAFEMDEFLYELREHSAGLNCGRWDYLFSFIKKFRLRSNKVLPDRVTVGMERPFLSAYVRLLIKTCHRRGVHAMGGMSAFIPIKNDINENNKVLTKVSEDKLREVKAGHDGTWVAHPGLIDVCRKIFDDNMPGPNQLHVLREDVFVSKENLWEIGIDTGVTEAGVRGNIDISLRYIEAWLRGIGCVPIHNLMEDAATAEISRVQIWHWLRHSRKLVDGRVIDTEFVELLLQQVISSVQEELGNSYSKSRFNDASRIFSKLIFQDHMPEFLTIEAYPLLVKLSTKSKL